MDNPEEKNNNIKFEPSPHLPDVDKIYFNGYSFSLTPTDFRIVLLINDDPVCVLFASHSVAKTLGESMAKTFTEFEEDTKIHILKIDELANIINESTKKQNS